MDLEIIEFKKEYLEIAEKIINQNNEILKMNATLLDALARPMVRAINNKDT